MNFSQIGRTGRVSFGSLEDQDLLVYENKLYQKGGENAWCILSEGLEEIGASKEISNRALVLKVEEIKEVRYTTEKAKEEENARNTVFEK